MEQPRQDITVELTVEKEIPEKTSGSCPLTKELEPCLIVIFGATGDLTARKLFPALYNLFQNKGLPEKFAILGVARSEHDDASFARHLRDSLESAGEKDLSQWDEMAARLHFQQLRYDVKEDFVALAKRAKELDAHHGLQGNRLFDLAVPPVVYGPIFLNLGAAGLASENTDGLGWSRVVIEKPFGSDLESARQLHRDLSLHFCEHQAFRIDHYLAKETVQNILMLRFANAIFEPLWNRNYIECIRISALETLGVEHRAGFYEKTGVLRDMFQNHMMQLLAMCTMEPPSLFEAERVRDETTKVFRCLKPFPVRELNKNLVLGQYAAGRMGEGAVPSYVEEQGIAPDSLTPTFAHMRVFVENWRWQGVPIYLTSGKRLAEKRTEIVVQFKEVPSSLFRNVLGEHVTANRLILGVYPDEKVELTFQAKTPGPRICLRSVTMNFSYYQGISGPSLDSYEKVLLDCLLGDHTLFWRQDAVELTWRFLTPVLQECDCEGRPPMHLYRAGSSGPEAAAEI